MDSTRFSIRERLGGPEYERLFAAVRRRLEAAGDGARSVTLTGLGHAERKALADLHGWTTLPRDRVSVSLAKLDEILRVSSVNAGIVEVVEALGGPLADRRAAKEAAREAKKRLWAQAAVNRHVMGRPELGRWLDEIRSIGVLTRSAHRANVDEAVLLELALEVVGRLPAQSTLLGVLAAEVTGDAHALDPGCLLGALVLRAAAHLAGWPEVPSAAPAKRRLWAEVGVLCDPLSAHVLVFGLRPAGTDRLAHHLREWADAGEPRRITLRELDGSQLKIATGAHLFVCENPAVIAAAADHLGERSGALLCVEGIPSTAALELLRLYRQCGAQIRFHADFDWGGIRIGNLLAEQFGAVPWRFTASDYRAALSTASESVPLKGAAVSADWDPDLDGAMRGAGRAVFEEQMIPILLDDLSHCG
jgi:uncharacterized protein (TIGR02679 family)